MMFNISGMDVLRPRLGLIRQFNPESCSPGTEQSGQFAIRTAFNQFTNKVASPRADWKEKS